MLVDDTAQSNAIVAHDLGQWLIEMGLSGASHEDVLDGYCRRLIQAGVPLVRMHVSQSSFHPHFGGMGFSWMDETGVDCDVYAYREQQLDVWLTSPLYHLLANNLPEYRERLADQKGPSRFPLLDELRARGASDYFAMVCSFAGEVEVDPADPESVPEGALISWTAQGPGCFSEADLALIRATLQHLAIVLKSAANRRIARDLMQIYLGRDAGNRVLSGEIRRGSVQAIDAAICYFDLIGFTSLAERVPGNDVIEMLNTYLGLVVSVIEDLDGHVLKFMGDGLMAMFDVGNAQMDAKQALRAARILSHRIESLNLERASQGVPSAGFTLALHAGEILYGNIGGENRLDFTVIGPAVNLTGRLSSMHKAIGHNILVTEDVREAAGPDCDDLVSVGRYMLRGASEPIELFTLYSPADDA